MNVPARRRWVSQTVRQSGGFGAGSLCHNAGARGADDLRRSTGSRGRHQPCPEPYRTWSGELQDGRTCAPAGRATRLPDGPDGARGLRARAAIRKAAEHLQSPSDEPVVLLARLVVRGSAGVRPQGGGT
jgi:hypothetical protein